RTLRAAEDFPWEHYTYLVGPRGAEEGYVVYHHRKSVGTPWDYNIGVNDWAFTTERAGRRMLSFLKFHVGQAKFVRWVCGPTGGPLFMDREQWGEFARREIWMLRIVDVRKALAMRGYAPGVEVDVVLDIEDDIVRRNNGRFRFQVRGGRARVTTSRDGQRAVSLHVRSLAPLYSGLHSPTSLARMDRIDGHPDDLGLLGTAFAGPAPWMREHF
ncbi:MAG: GNAT family N-acetyltransferase, partial [Planctomycetota bacterium]